MAWVNIGTSLTQTRIVEVINTPMRQASCKQHYHLPHCWYDSPIGLCNKTNYVRGILQCCEQLTYIAETHTHAEPHASFKFKHGTGGLGTARSLPSRTTGTLRESRDPRLQSMSGEFCCGGTINHKRRLYQTHVTKRSQPFERIFKLWQPEMFVLI